ncbi:cupin domain-containing protein [Kineococcus arenarius]|uniref:cupin domain-containing protein n=1 Tax=unclassified Kineococcus TaxID=2621656 RepID=UPI003D7C71AE
MNTNAPTSPMPLTPTSTVPAARTAPRAFCITSSTTERPARIQGVHGTVGWSGWKALAARRHLQAPIEAVEWATIPAGGISGEHLHSRTEEIYLILRGHGDFLLDGTAHPVHPGSLAFTGLGHVHGLVSTRGERIEWLVIETLAAITQERYRRSTDEGSSAELLPQTSALAERGHQSHPATTGTTNTHGTTRAPRTAGSTPHQLPGSTGGIAVGHAVIVDLNDQPVIDASDIFTGPLRRVERCVLAAGEQRCFGQDDAETVIFIDDGTLQTNIAGEEHLRTGSCLTLPAGEKLLVGAQQHSRLYVITLVVPSGQP